MDKKRLKWQADKQSQDLLVQQEVYDKQKFTQNRMFYLIRHFWCCLNVKFFIKLQKLLIIAHV
jgi:hypothetical protein